MKNIIKEIIIILLLIFAILLILGVLLYGYVPNNKEIPEPIAYTTPKSVKEKLVTIEGVDEEEVILTYELDKTDLNNYQRINEYKPGKTNPFSTYEVKPAQGNTTGNTTEGGTTGGTSSGTISGNLSGSTTIKNEVYTAPTSQGGVNPGTYTNKSGTK